MTTSQPYNHMYTSTPARLRPVDLEVLRILWTHGPLTIRTIYTMITTQRAADYLGIARAVVYLNRQGLLDRRTDEEWLDGNYRYVAAVSERDYASM